MNGLDMVYAEIRRRVGPEMDARMEQLAKVLLPALNDGTPLDSVPTPPPPGTPAPTTAAKRTLVQGVVATILAAIFGVAADTISGGDFQVFDLGDWAGLGTSAVTVAVVAALAYGQRKIGR